MPPPYQPVGKCIYCGSTAYRKDQPNDARELGEEHIVPRSIGGTMVLPRASCLECESITSGFEDKCLKGFFQSRAHLGLKSRRTRKQPNKLAVFVQPTEWQTGFMSNLSLSDHPGIIFNILAPPAGLFTGILPRNEYYGVSGTWVVDEVQEKLKRFRGSRIYFNGKHGTKISDYGRLLAKIAHSYAVAELGLYGFDPLLVPYIREESLDLWNYVGSALHPEPVSSSLHEVSFVSRKTFSGEDVLTCRIRLFAQFDTPIYYVIVGRYRSTSDIKVI